MNRVISVHDAQIKTASVEIKSLTVSGKQVTMGVFRQLLVEDVIDPETADLAGVPWGLVNYFPKPCNDDHLHVVWQKGEELRRACVYSRLPYDQREGHRAYMEGLDEALRPVVEWCLIEETLRGEQHEANEHSALWRSGGYTCWHSLHTSRYQVTDYTRTLLGRWIKADPEEMQKPWDEYDYTAREYKVVGTRGDRLARDLRLHQQEVAAKHALPAPDYGAVAALARERIDEYVAERREFEAHVEKYERHYAELAALDQLFIAV